MACYLLDTNIFSRYLRNRKEDRALCDKVEEMLPDCVLSAIVLAELEYGASKRPDVPVFAERIQTLKTAFPEIFSFDAPAANHAGYIRAFLENLKPNAQPIGHYDALIAGHALSLGAILVTDNRTEFARVPGLSVENWRE